MRVIFLSRTFFARAAAALRPCPACLLPAIPPLLTAAALFTCLLGAFTNFPAAAAGRPAAAEHPQLPSAYGEIIYRINEESAGQVYIIGISHRDAASRSNNDDTVRTQAEIFRIGEWLNSNRQLELLLPEGYFRSDGEAAGQPHPVRGGSSLSGFRLNNELLFARLADESRFVNAEILLMEQFGMHASQVEDRGTYQAVCKSLNELSCERLPTVDKLAELQYLQEIRTARLLQKIPAAIASERAQGTIRNRSAMLTIGLNHIQDIIRYIQENTIRVAVPRSDGNGMANYQAKPELLRQGYGITIIIPRTLADDRPLLRLTNLDRLLLAEETPPGN
ncbi:MAG: hypothetical protein C4531_04550 [Desulfurivibrio sp.]|nr:MAG: hypothetical protein C4531_04550 [Desulfurivibrio sp.]